VTRDGHLGVQFTTIAAIDRDHIVHFAYVRERARREREIARWR
jgi:c-di-GMP-binding flagellar brake protein YcgR